MKKVLVLIISVFVVISAFTACSNSDSKPKETTTVDVSNIDIINGVVSGENYVNKSLGIKIKKPDELAYYSYGDAVFTVDNDFVLPDYYLIDEKYEGKGDKLFQIDILDKKYKSISDWDSEIEGKSGKNNVTKKKNMNIGYRAYNVYVVNKKVLFATFDNGKLALFTFNNYSYDDAVKFIQDNFKTI